MQDEKSQALKVHEERIPPEVRFVSHFRAASCHHNPLMTLLYGAVGG